MNLKNNIMNIDDILSNKQVVNAEKFELGKEAQEVSSKVVLDIMRNLGDRQAEELILDFFFYTDERSKAEGLAEVLRKFGYTLGIYKEEKGELKFSVIGQTIPLPNEDDVVLNWCRKMNELGYIHDCAFDGWGTPVVEGGWFGDNTPEHELRKRLGLPPLEE